MKARISFRENSKVLFDALSPETRFGGKRSKTKVTLERGTLHIDINAKDVNSLRATSNSYIKMAKAVIECMEEV
jgi:tRNA threonylcarbamoyladenosine modification (KEOPS) complex  Pcc1 subunit